MIRTLRKLDWPILGLVLLTLVAPFAVMFWVNWLLISYWHWPIVSAAIGIVAGCLMLLAPFVLLRRRSQTPGSR